MTVIAAVQKDNEIAIACDTLTTNSRSGYQISAEYKANHHKLIQFGENWIGFSGSCAIHQILEELLLEESENLPSFASRSDIFKWLLSIQPKLKETYFIKESEKSGNPLVESNQISAALIANPQGIFRFNSSREVSEYLKFWAIGSGQLVALGAMEALYELDFSATDIASAAALAATKFCSGCAPPIYVETIQKPTKTKRRRTTRKKKS